MAGLVQEHSEVAIDAVEHGDVAVGVVGMATVWVGQSDHVAHPLSHVYWYTAEEVDHVVDRVRAVFVAAEQPRGTALQKDVSSVSLI